MNRRRKTLAQIARLENATKKLEDVRYQLWEANEPMLAGQIASVLTRAALELERARHALHLSMQYHVPVPEQESEHSLA